MMRFLKTVLVFCFFIGLLGCQSSVQGNRPLSVPGSEKTFENVLKSTVALVEYAENGWMIGPNCSAFYISPRKIATAHHCVEDDGMKYVQSGPRHLKKVKKPNGPEPTIGRTIHFVNLKQEEDWLALDQSMRKPEGPESKAATVVAASKEADVAVLQLKDDERDNRNWLKLRNIEKDPVRAGERVYSVGSPVSQTWTLSEGIVSRVIMIDTNVRIRHQVRIGPGSSGSALLDNEGKVIGINIELTRGSYVSIATPVSYLRTQLKLLETNEEIEKLDRKFEEKHNNEDE